LIGPGRGNETPAERRGQRAEEVIRAERRDLKGQARLFRALGHESRLLIVTHLEGGECCVCDLAEKTGLDQSTVSKHLALLAGNGIVEGERRGHHVYYHVTAAWVIGLLRERPWAEQRLE
jgi:ArsR family transcriptional regulator